MLKKHLNLFTDFSKVVGGINVSVLLPLVLFPHMHRNAP